MAVKRYSGLWSEASYLEHERALMSELETSGYRAVGTPEWARYDPPFMPWFMRRNEVMVEVRPTG